MGVARASGSQVLAARTPSLQEANSARVRYMAAKRLAYPLCVTASVTLAAVAILRVASVLTTAGVDVLGNDYLLYMGTFNRILAGTYDWRSLPSDVFLVGSHFVLIPTLIRLALVNVTHWSVYPELYIGFAASLLRLVLYFDVVSRVAPSRLRWLILPLLAILVFSMSQIDLFTYGDAALTIGLNQLGLAIGVWALVRFPLRWTGLLLMSVGGILACYSGGGGLPVWPAFLIGLILVGERRTSRYAVWAAAALVSTFPYIWFDLVRPVQESMVFRLGPYPHMTGARLLNPLSIIEGIGAPFGQADAAGASILPGALGFLLGAVGLVLVYRSRREPWFMQFAPGLMLIVAGMCSVLMAACLRGTIDPWHAPHFVTIWIGLVAIAYVLLAHRARGRRAMIWSGTLLEIVLLLSITSNVSYADKSVFLQTRAPASAECLRNYQTAPLYCEGYLWNWGVSPPGFISILGRPLERYHLSVFAPHQEWLLQGDFGLQGVALRREDTGAVRWTSGNGLQNRHWSSYQHLDLALRGGNALSWRVHLPSNTLRADLVTAVSQRSTHGTAITPARIDLTPAGMATRPIYIGAATPKGTWQPVRVPLAHYAGRTVTLRFTPSVFRAQPTGWTIFRYPVLDVLVDPGRSAGHTAGAARWPPQTERDTVLRPGDRSWRATNLRRISSVAPVWHVSAKTGHLLYPHPLTSCLNDYSMLEVRAGVSERVFGRGIRVGFQLGPGSRRKRSATFPLLLDGGQHVYSYPLRLLQLPPNAEMSGVTVTPLSSLSHARPYDVTISWLRLVRNSTDQCTAGARHD